MDAPFRDYDGYVVWARNLPRRELDLIEEHRGPKGSGKSNGMMWNRFRIDLILTAIEDRLNLCYNTRQFAGIYERVREERKTDHVRPKFICGDDADQLFDRRGHSSLKNRAMLGLVRKARDQLRCIIQLGTQDDFLERPLLPGGPFIRFVYDRPFEADMYWPVFPPMREGDPKWEYVDTVEYPDPYATYPETWRALQAERRRLTTDGTQDLLDIVNPKPVSQERESQVRDAILAEARLDVTANTAEVVRRLKAKGMDVSYGYARQVLAIERGPKKGNYVSGGRPAAAAPAPR